MILTDKEVIQIKTLLWQKKMTQKDLGDELGYTKQHITNAMKQKPSYNHISELLRQWYKNTLDKK